MQQMRGRRGRSWLIAGVDDGTNVMQCVWFQGVPYWQKNLPVGEMVAVSGVPVDKGVWQFIHPAVDRLGESGDRVIQHGPDHFALSWQYDSAQGGAGGAALRRILRTAISNSEIDSICR
jgi:RecG-like helicase